MYVANAIQLTFRQLTPQLLKSGVTDALNALLEPIQAEFKASKEWQEVEQKAYPPPQVKTKPKKEKKIGDKYPGVVRDQVKPDEKVQEEQEKYEDKLVTGLSKP